jgi:sortase A
MPKRKAPKRKINKLFVFGLVCILVSLAIPTSIFLPVAKAEIAYQITKSSPSPIATPTPVDQEFSIQIPKINVNTKVIPNVNPFEPKLYQPALTRGVAHAQGSSLPDKPGNTFIFAHSASSWYEANQFNAVFYLTSKLEKGDSIHLTYKNKLYDYRVSETKIVDPRDVSFLANNATDPTLTLMTCWPPGTTAKRLLVIAKPVELLFVAVDPKYNTFTQISRGNNPIALFNLTYPTDWKLDNQPSFYGDWKIVLSKASSQITMNYAAGGGPGECLFSDQNFPEYKDYLQYNYKKYKFKEFKSSLGLFRFPIKSGEAIICQQDSEGHFQYSSPIGNWKILYSNQNTEEITQILKSVAPLTTQAVVK